MEVSRWSPSSTDYRRPPPATPRPSHLPSPGLQLPPVPPAAVFLWLLPPAGLVETPEVRVLLPPFLSAPLGSGLDRQHSASTCGLIGSQDLNRDKKTFFFFFT